MRIMIFISIDYDMYDNIISNINTTNDNNDICNN